MPNFVSFVASIAELARGEKLHTQSINHSLTHSPSLFNALGTEAFASELGEELNPTNDK